MSNQFIQQSGDVTAGHLPVWVAPGVLRDAGPSIAGTINSIGLYGLGGTPLVITNKPLPAPWTGPYSQLGFGISQSAAYLTVNSLNGATEIPFEIRINGQTALSLSSTGVEFPFPVGVAGGGTGLSTIPTDGQLLIGDGTGYTLATLTAGANIAISDGPGTITISAVAGGGVLPVLNGGTGANTAAGAMANLAGILALANIATLRGYQGPAQSAVYVEGYFAPADGGEGIFIYVAVDTGSGDNGGTVIVDAEGRRYHRDTQGLPYSVQWFGAKGDGVTNDAPVIQVAATAAITAKTALYVPAASVGYLVDTAINLTDLDGALTIVGDGINAPAFGLAIIPPVGGSLFLGNTGTGKPVFDCSGSSNIIFRDLNINAIGQATPSTIGILFATSTTSPQAQAPGGSNCGAENVAVYMPNANNSMPIAWVAGAGLGHFFNVWTLGVYGIAISSNNTLQLSSPYVTFPSGIGVDGITAVGCTLLGYGGGPVLYLEASNNQSWDQLYVATILSGPSYAGQPYAIHLQGVTDVRIKVECDYFPSLLFSVGNLIGAKISGTVFPNTTPIPAEVPIIAFFDSFAVTTSSFDVIAVSGALPNNNYFYTTTGGVSPTVSGFNNCEFIFDTTVSPNVFFGNAMSGESVAFFNLRFNGSTDAGGGPMTFLIDGSPAPLSQQRYFMNGKLVGTG